MLCTECNKVIKPIVAIDIDGTLGDYHGHFLQFAEQYMNRPFNPNYDGRNEMHEHMDLNLEEYRQIKLAYRQGGGKRMMPLISGDERKILELIHNSSEIWLTTTRPYNKFDSTDPDTRHWLHRHQLPYDYLFYEDNKYEALAEVVEPWRVAVVVDDLPSQLEVADKYFKYTLLRRTRYNKAIPWEGNVIGGFNNAYYVIVNRLKEWFVNYGQD
jgi:hypothetical protein